MKYWLEDMVSTKLAHMYSRIVSYAAGHAWGAIVYNVYVWLDAACSQELYEYCIYYVVYVVGITDD